MSDNDLTQKQDVLIRYCDYCEENKPDVYNTYDGKYNLCSECIEHYDNSSGYCSLRCAMGNGCDETC